MAINRFSQSTAQSAFPKFTNFWDGTTATSSFDSLGTVLVTSDTASVTFSSIPQTYTNLQVRISNGKMDRPATFGDFQLQINGDSTGYNYVLHQLSGNGTAASASYTPTTTNLPYWSFSRLAGNSDTLLTAIAILDIVDYSTTNKTKVVRTISGVDANGSGEVNLQSGLYTSGTAAITSLVFLTGYGSTVFKAPTQFSLYGIK